MRSRLTAYTALVTLAACVCGTLAWRWWHRPIATFDLGRGRSIRIWSERDWDPDHAFPGVYYEVRDAGRAVTASGWLGVDRGQVFEFKLVFAENNDLACVYVTNHPPRDHSFFVILYDGQSQESYPRLREDVTMWMPHVSRKWVARYAALREANPELPELKYLTDPNWYNK